MTEASTGAGCQMKNIFTARKPAWGPRNDHLGYGTHMSQSVPNVSLSESPPSSKQHTSPTLLLSQLYFSSGQFCQDLPLYTYLLICYK